jgi:ferredoxin-NADP reductase
MGVQRDSLKLRVARRAEVTADTVLIDFESVGGEELPAWSAGAHVEVRLPSGLLRQYSLCGDTANRGAYRVAVLRVVGGRGGSLEFHRDVPVGTELEVRPPRNNFALVDAASYLFVAGGIGITPIKAMIDEVAARQRDWRLVYGGRSAGSMAFATELAELGGDRVQLVPQDTQGTIDVAGALDGVADGTHIYCCGPAGLLDAVAQECTARGWTARLHVERFTASSLGPVTGGDAAFDVELRRSNVVLHVPADQSLLEVVRSVRGDIEFSCQEGYCGSCETRVLGGEPDHRGTLMSPEEHDEEGTMLICVGRCKSPLLILDI